jgi:hypothetical protein
MDWRDDSVLLDGLNGTDWTITTHLWSRLLQVRALRPERRKLRKRRSILVCGQQRHLREGSGSAAKACWGRLLSGVTAHADPDRPQAVGPSHRLDNVDGWGVRPEVDHLSDPGR